MCCRVSPRLLLLLENLVYGHRETFLKSYKERNWEDSCVRKSKQFITQLYFVLKFNFFHRWWENFQVCWLHIFKDSLSMPLTYHSAIFQFFVKFVVRKSLKINSDEIFNIFMKHEVALLLKIELWMQKLIRLGWKTQ